jgi:predicted membrane metal-binding protein
MKPSLSIFNYFPFVRFTLAFIAGIIIRNCFDKVPLVYLIPVAAVILITLMFSANIPQTYNKIRAVSLLMFISLIGAGFLYTHFYTQALFDKTIPEKGTYSGVILDKAPAKNDRYKYTLELDCIKRNDSLKYINEKILLYNSDSATNSLIEPGKRVLFQSQLYEIKKSNNPCEFDYQNYMKVKGIRYQAFVKNGIAFTKSEHFNIRTSALNFRSKLMKIYRSEGINGDEYAVLCALALGDKIISQTMLKVLFRPLVPCMYCLFRGCMWGLCS